MAVPYFPFTGEPHAPAMGLKPLDLARWIEPDDELAAQARLKARLLRTERRRVLLARPQAAEACRELHTLLAGHLAQYHPEHYTLIEGELGVLATGARYPEEPPRSGPEAVLATLSGWVQEDLCLLSPTPPVALMAGLVCFPSRWNLAEKFGMDSDAIHAPVPGFAGALGASTRNFLERVAVEKPVWRMNWTVHDRDELFAPGPVPPRDDLTPGNVLRETFLRVERQTLRRLPESGAVVFTIRTYVHRMADVVDTEERRAAARGTLETLPAEILSYRGMAKLIGPLLEALRR
jgi:dimethylamine monooxygenase subunit A